MEGGQNYLRGSLWRRFFASLIDDAISIFLPTLLFALLDLIIVNLGITGLMISPIEQLISWLIAFLYGPIMIWKFGATLGKKWLKLRIVESTTYGSVGLRKAFLREWVGKLVSTLVFGLGYIWPLIDKGNQAWHDKIGGTFVAAVDQQGNLIPSEEQTVSTGRKVLFWILLALSIVQTLILLLVILSYLFTAKPIQIKGQAMNPNYKNGQYWITNTGAYRNTEPQRGDVIIFYSPKTPEVKLIERVIGLPSDKVKISQGKIYVNGSTLDESSYLTSDVYTGPESFIQENSEIIVPDRHYIVLGDNRPHSSDSRDFGPVPKENIVGKVAICYWKCSE